MEIVPYGKKYPEIVRELYKAGILTRYPVQSHALIEYDNGVDVTYHLKGLTPRRFEQVADYLLEASLMECERYEEAKWYFTKLEVKLNRTDEGKSKYKESRWYMAQKHDVPGVMVYGEKALGYELPKGEYKPYLVNKVEEILKIPEGDSPGPFLKKNKPYIVKTMVVCMRAGQTRPYIEGELPEFIFPPEFKAKHEAERQRLREEGKIL